MKCPECYYHNSKIINSRKGLLFVRRRRECLRCKSRFTTYEIYTEDLCYLRATARSLNLQIEAFDKLLPRRLET